MLTILIVDASPLTARLMQVNVEREFPCHVCVARNGDSALAAVLHSPPDMIICDTALPDIDSYALIRQLRVNSPSAPIIVVSAHSRPCDVAKAFSVGAASYITKPFDWPVFVQTLRYRLECTA